MDSLQQLFADKLHIDDRESIWAFSIPGLDGTYALYAPRLQLWKQLLTVRGHHHHHHNGGALLIG